MPCRGNPWSPYGEEKEGYGGADLQKRKDHNATYPSHNVTCHLTHQHTHTHIRTVADPVKFRKLLKIHYFSEAFNIC